MCVCVCVCVSKKCVSRQVMSEWVSMNKLVFACERAAETQSKEERESRK